jgi:hypothetical protein
VLVVQLPGEEPMAFARRLLQKVVRLVGRGAELVSVALAMNSRYEPRDLEARCVIAPTSLRTFRAGGNCRLHLVESSSVRLALPLEGICIDRGSSIMGPQSRRPTADRIRLAIRCG